jgi:polyhydroxybutyrate depolymerase
MLIDGWRKIADREGFILVYPQGTGYPLGWNGSETFRSEKDDIQYLRDIITDLHTVLEIDPGRVYINGVSNGGMMALNAACEATDVFAAAGSVGAPIEFEQMACQPNKPIPLMVFHGLSDPGMPYNGGEMKLLGKVLNISPPPFMYPVEMFAAYSSQKLGCPTAPETVGPIGDVTIFSYSPCEQGSEVTLYKLENHGHTWPGGPPIPFAGSATQDIHASEEMLEFFSRHPMK